MKSEDLLARFAQDHSKHFRCPALAVLNHDDDILAYVLYDSGKKDHNYNSDPQNFEGEQLDGDFALPPEQMPPAPEDWDTAPAYTGGGDAGALARLIGNDADIAEVDRILHAPNLFDDDEDDDDADFDDENDFTFAITRHQALLSALRLPLHSLTFDVRNFTGEDARHYDMTGILKIGGSAN